MAKAIMTAGLVALSLISWNSAALAGSGAKPAQILQYRPKQDGVVITTPSEAEAEACTVKWSRWMVLSRNILSLEFRQNSRKSLACGSGHTES